jgi:hypothetical protein
MAFDLRLSTVFLSQFRRVNVCHFNYGCDVCHLFFFCYRLRLIDQNGMQ